MLYDLGYSNFGSSDPVLHAIRILGAILVDVRYLPHSQDAQWDGIVLSQQLGSRYVHVKDLGNVNYRGSGNVIQNLEKGMKTVEKMLADSPAVLMCVCGDRSNCHRMIPIREFEKMGIVCAELTRKLVDELLRGAASEGSEVLLRE